jgi:hypothetical protein
LVDAGSDRMSITTKGDSLTHYAVATCNHHLVTFMLASGTPIDHCNNDSVSPLHLSVYLGNASHVVTSILLGKGARLESPKLSSLVAALWLPRSDNSDDSDDFSSSSSGDDEDEDDEYEDDEYEDDDENDNEDDDDDPEVIQALLNAGADINFVTQRATKCSIGRSACTMYTRYAFCFLFTICNG